MTIDKPKVLIIRIKGNLKSENDALVSKQSWEDQGFCVDFFDAVTPDDLDVHDYLDFGTETLRLNSIAKKKFRSEDGKLKEDQTHYRPFKENNKFYLRKISPTEKAVYYSHVEIWKYIAATKLPHIVVEDDCVLIDKIPEDFGWDKWYFYAFSNCLLWSYYCHPKLAEYLVEFIGKYNLGLGDKWPKGFQSNYYSHRPILFNVDGFLMAVLGHLSHQHLPDDKFYDRLNYADNFFYDWFKGSSTKTRNRLANNYIVRRKIIQHKVGKRFIDHRHYQEIEKKVAVMVNGMIPEYLSKDQVRDSIHRLWLEFKGCDIYYQTWDTPEQRRLVSDVIGERVKVEFIKPPPECSYNPYGLVNEEIDEKYWKHLMRFVRNSKRNTDVCRSSACNQQLSFWEQWKHIPKGYDYYVRTRWDIYFNDDLPLEELYALADDNVIGLGSPTRTTHRKLKVDFSGLEGKHPIKNPEVWDKYCKRVQKKRGIYKDHIDNSFYCVVGEDTLDGKGNMNTPIWNHFLSDMMIIFKESDMEGIDVSKMYELERLYPCEYGWHQILCNKRQHKNIDALVAIKRNILSDKKFLEHCWRLGV